MRLGHFSLVKFLEKKKKSIHGNIKRGESLITNFYCAILRKLSYNHLDSAQWDIKGEHVAALSC